MNFQSFFDLVNSRIAETTKALGELSGTRQYPETDVIRSSLETRLVELRKAEGIALEMALSCLARQKLVEEKTNTVIT